MSVTTPTVHIVDDDASFLAAASRLLRASVRGEAVFVGERLSRAARHRCAGLCGG